MPKELTPARRGMPSVLTHGRAEPAAMKKGEPSRAIRGFGVSKCTVGGISPWVPAGYWAEAHPVIVSVLASMVLAALTLAAWGASRKLSAWRAARRPA